MTVPDDVPANAPIDPLGDAIARLPQHPPMRLLDRAVRIDADRAVAELDVRADSPFLLGGADRSAGVPSWVALEYLGQTAALIGTALEDGEADGHDGFLLGSRTLDLDPEPFRIGETLTVSCTARGEVGATLATFDGEVRDASGRLRASGTLSVVRVARERGPAEPAAPAPGPP